MSLLLTDAARKRLKRAQRALLHVPALGPVRPGASSTGSLPAWVEAVSDALRPLFHTDHVYYTEPAGLEPSLAGGSDASSAPDLFVCNPSADDAFPSRLQGHFTGFQDGFSQFGDAPATLIRRLVRSAGTGAFHDAPLYDADRQAASPLYQQVFRPAGIQRKLALSVPLAQGEAMLIVGFPETDVPDFEGHRHRLLELLLPAFEAGLRFRRHLIRRPIGLESVPENAPIPLIFFDDAGRERYRNEAFEDLLRSLGPGALTAHDLHTAARAAAEQLEPGEVHGGVVTNSLGPFRLRACANVARNDVPGVLVFVEHGDRRRIARRRPDGGVGPARIFPPPAAIAAATGLTPRQAEVACLLAEGLSDQAVADALGISVYTARRHTADVLQALHLDSRAGVAVTLLRACR